MKCEDFGLSPEAFEQRIRADMKFVIEYLSGRDKQHFAPMLIVHGRDYEGDSEKITSMCIQIEVDLNDPPTRRKMMKSLGQMVKDKRLMPVAIIWMCDAWTVELKPGETINCRPALDPRRKEAINIAAYNMRPPTDKNRTASTYLLYDRDPRTQNILPRKFIDIVYGAELPLLEVFFAGFFADTYKQIAESN